MSPARNDELHAMMADLPVHTMPGGAGSGTSHDVEKLLRTEWLLTNGLGGFAMGTALGAMSRRYHGLLVTALRPPVQRIMALNAVSETVVLGEGTPAEQRFDLSTLKFRPGVLHPRGDMHLVKFEKDVSARWTYRCGSATVVKEVHLFREAPAVAVRYKVTDARQGAKFTVRPLVSLRDFHSLILRDTSRDRFRVEVPPAPAAPPAACVVHAHPHSLHIHALTSPGMAAVFRHEEQWWYDFQYDQERDRGYDYLEDLFHPGSFEVKIEPFRDSATFTVQASLGSHTPRDIDDDAEHRRKRLVSLVRATLPAPTAPGAVGRKPSKALAALAAASDDYVVRRVPPATGPLSREPDRTTIIAGYPWFADWGRDSMISLPGLLLVTGRFPEARDVLLAFANNRAGGLIPNVFDDYTGLAHHNTVDASLWFIHAACLYRQTSGDALTFKDTLLPACLDIVKHYRQGTSFGIGMDPADGLVFAGDPSTQLTWMDAKRDGIAFTPRHGKAVEINALWFNALASLVESGTGVPDAAELAALRDKVGASFRGQFWNPALSCLVDHLTPPAGSGHGSGQAGAWQAQAEVRPNQIFAASLPHSPLSLPQRASVVAYVQQRLLTPLGVRTLDPADSRYKGRYRGTMFARDSAYHNGTAWPWLLGAVAEATLRTGAFTPEARQAARRVLQPVLDWLNADCPGQIAEVFDGDHTPGEPQRPGGCPAQAWSVAEPLRVLAMIEKAESGA